MKKTFILLFDPGPNWDENKDIDFHGFSSLFHRRPCEGTNPSQGLQKKVKSR